jgi:hypothetical protein
MTANNKPVNNREESLRLKPGGGFYKKRKLTRSLDTLVFCGQCNIIV